MSEHRQRFAAICESSPEIKARFDAYANAAIAEVKASIGIDLTADDVLDLDRVRLAAVIGEDFDLVSLLVDASKLTKTQTQLAERSRADMVLAGDKEELDRVNSLSRVQRMEYARTHLQAQNEGPKSGGSIADASGSRAIFESLASLRPADRIAAARKLGLTK
ncbi:hypothetical protein EF888_06925 [Silicimonas algicola]|uniref:Uncharacterized protein n=1 Tax=Silicimonas algicola TaxID=1826607 RepID=A0A316G2M8_9RHOB|nr:hypothetical protein [Silicimonas algicola]AZQ66895.1 hypothetical protein EF888_06925 [Silicimonas algicola]PWK55191.1 hypothetical protein C8D95_10870 [Silicimonas algicola]